MPLRPTTAFVTAILAFLPLRLAALDLQLESVHTETSPFIFTKTFAESVGTPVPIGRDAFIASSPNYDIWMDLDGVSEVQQFGYFRYEIYVRPKASPTQVTRVTFQGQTDGAFDDQFVAVHFAVGDGTKPELGTIMLPIFGRYSPKALSSLQPGDPIPVFVATDKEISVPLSNELKRMPVTITGASASPNDRTLWKCAGRTGVTSPICALEIRGAASAPFAPFQIAKGDTNSEDLCILLRPQIPQAFSTALIRGKGNEDDVITVLVKYKTLGRAETSSPIRVRVQFIPWPPFLVLMAMSGAVLGWLGLLVVKAKKEEAGEQLRILGAALLAAFLVEVLGMLLVAGGSELKILGQTMDPFRMLPAALIGVIAGLAGYQSRSFLLKISQRSFFKFSNTGE